MARLEGKVAVITGATGGIGNAAARLFADEGASVALVDIDEANLQAVVREIGENKASYTVADVTQPEQSQAYVDAAVNRWGRHRHSAGERGHRGHAVAYHRISD